MAYVYEDRNYAPCSYLIVKTNGDPYKEKDTVLVQLDWDYPGIADSMGLRPCCDNTDGTIDCEHKTVNEMISNAREFIDNNLEIEFEGLDVYFE